jgi:transcriptional accessory protein Tex/SPT6
MKPKTIKDYINESYDRYINATKRLDNMPPGDISAQTRAQLQAILSLIIQADGNIERENEYAAYKNIAAVNTLLTRFENE